MRGEVPLRGQLRKGYVIAISEESSYHKVQSIKSILSASALITAEIFELAKWMSKYYCSPLHQVFKSIIPGSIRGNLQHKEQLFVVRNKTREEIKDICCNIRQKFPAQGEVLDVMLKVKGGILLSELMEKAQVSKSPITTLGKKGILKLDIVRIDRSPLIGAEYFKTQHKTLTEEQFRALEKIKTSIIEKRFETHLLYGITGSGKTEVYLQAIDLALKEGKGSIMLVPEISLTTQTIEHFRSRFDDSIAILHHRLSAGERHDEWHKIHRGEAKIVIGARSAIFCPIVNLGLIIVDEEHESSYKQTEEMPRYHARDIAVMRGHLKKCTVILGSATPSLESYHNAEIGKYTLSLLSKRATNAELPSVTIMDMKDEDAKAKCMTTFSDLLLKKIRERIEKGEQTILFLNRRGYHAFMLCKSCSNAVKCQHCDIALTFHRGDNILSCHLCGYTLSPPPHLCPSCRAPETMKYRGVGTEQVERALHAIFPNIRTLRLDADTTRHKGSYDKIFREFRTGKADVLIGTQMIAKGLHFPQVTLVGVLNSDTSLNIPDFRSSERVFQLLTQVAGRSGRGAIHGEVVIQTRIPQNTTIKLASEQDYLKFYTEEHKVRKAFNYPPISHMVKMTFIGSHEAETRKDAEKCYRSLLLFLSKDYSVTPPLPAGYAKVKDRFYFQFVITGPRIFTINKSIDMLKKRVSLQRQTKLTIDVDPLSIFF